MNLSFLKFWRKPAVHVLQKGFLALSRMDGKPGLSAADFRATVAKVVEIQASYKKAGGAVKARAVGAWLLEQFSAAIDEYFIPALVARAYDYAADQALLPKP